VLADPRDDTPSLPELDEEEELWTLAGGSPEAGTSESESPELGPHPQMGPLEMGPPTLDLPEAPVGPHDTSTQSAPDPLQFSELDPHDVQLAGTDGDSSPASEPSVAHTLPPPASPDRTRADKLLTRAEQLLQRGFPDEALRLAQIAQRLELSQRAVYAADEMRPSDVIARIKSRPMAGQAARDTADTSKGEHRPQRGLPPARLDSNSSNSSNIAAEDRSVSRSVEGDGELASTATGPDETGAQLPVEGLDSLMPGAKRFVRAPHRKRPLRQSVVADRPSRLRPLSELDPGESGPEEMAESPAPAAPAELAECDPAEWDSEAELAHGSETGAGLAMEDAAPAPPIELDDANEADVEWPVLAEGEPAATLTPAVRRTWNEFWSMGLATGLASLVLLWLWRELERWHYRQTQAA